MSIAVIICGGAPAPALERISNLVDGYERVFFIGADRGALRLIRAGYTLDYAIGDFDSVTSSELAIVQANSQHFEQMPSEKDDTDMELAIALAFEQAPTGDYYVLGALGEKGGRLDHLISNLWLVHQPRFRSAIPRLHFIENHSDTCFYTAGQYEIENTHTQYLSIVALTPVKELAIHCAKYELPATSFQQPRAFISNEFLDTDVKLSFTEGIVMVMRVNEVR
ncbi:thiamine diphosphokinase [Aerococcaceae bacterium NML130460]|nr:thiamine diphosphokinase [Aerococcaceae bacterium NML130460]